jgi:hypothetical protein
VHKKPAQPIWSPSQGSKWVTNPVSGIHHKNCPISRQIFRFNFLQAAVAGPILDIGFLRNFRITVALETSKIIFACAAATQPAAKPPLLFS